MSQKEEGPSCLSLQVTTRTLACPPKNEQRLKSNNPCPFLTGCSKEDRKCSNGQWRQASTESRDHSKWSRGRTSAF